MRRFFNALAVATGLGLLTSCGSASVTVPSVASTAASASAPVTAADEDDPARVVARLTAVKCLGGIRGDYGRR